MAKLGIDLGTANSAAALLFEADKRNPIIVEPIEGPLHQDLVFPSYVAFDKQGKVSAVGLNARERYFFRGQSELVVRHFKRLIGRPYDYVAEQISNGNRAFLEFRNRIRRSDDGLILLTVGEGVISVIEIASHLLQKIFADAEVQLQKWGEEIEAVTVTLPAGFDDSQRQATVEAARMAGLKGVEIKVIEEPSAAAIAKGLGGVQGNIMVIDVGAGTTDVVIGYMETTQNGSKLSMTSRAGDDVLGGIDMDNLILDYIRENDTKSPKFRDIEANLNINERLRLMSAIEDAKIIASRDGSSTLIRTLATDPPKRIHIPLSEEQLASIVEPVVYGYTTDGHAKGIKHVVERVLLDAAGGNTSAVSKVIRQIEHLILVGGPSRMKCLRNMLRDIFRDNGNIAAQIESIDPEDRFFMEGVAKGAALCQVEGVDTTTTVPWVVSILHQTGITRVLASGTPYKRGESLSRTVAIPVHQGSNMLSVVSQKESQPKRQWSIRKHIVNVPQNGELQLTMIWGEGGAEAEKVRITGCGLPGTIGLSATKGVSTLGSDLEYGLRWYLEIARNLRNHIAAVRKPLLRWILPQVGTVHKAQQWVDEWLYIPESELDKCEAIEPDNQCHVTDSDIERTLATGRIEMRNYLLKKRELLSDKLIEIMDKIFWVMFQPGSIEELIIEAQRLIDLSQNCPSCSSFSQQLSDWLNRLETNSTNTAFAAAVATSLASLADCLCDQRVISEEDFFQIQDGCWRFRT
jgi:molecular chaperone DnaK (HSP70)